MTASSRPNRIRRKLTRLDRNTGGLAGDLTLYALSAGFATLTAANSTLLPHRAWGSLAAVGYLTAATVVIGQLLVRRHRPGAALVGSPARAVLTVLTWVGTALVPLLAQSAQRAAGRLDRAQEEVLVVERSGVRLVDTGSPYLGHDAIAALPADERLLGYTPYQPGMALFGLPRAAGTGWWTDARVWFALVTAGCLVWAVLVLRAASRATPSTDERSTGPSRAPGDGGTTPDTGRTRWAPTLVRAVQLATVLPVCALTLATGGDDLPVLALCLLALAFCAATRYGAAGLAVGLAAALKLFAWPVALVLGVHAATRGRRAGLRFAVPAVALPVAALVPAYLVDPPALVENLVRFPLGHGLVTSPAQSPLPGHLIATALPAGRVVAAALLVAAGLAIAVRLVRRPPHTAAAAALVCGYGLTAAIALMPATRFGYLLYPVALLAWAAALRASVLPAVAPADAMEPALAAPPR